MAATEERRRDGQGEKSTLPREPADELAARWRPRQIPRRLKLSLRRPVAAIRVGTESDELAVDLAFELLDPLVFWSARDSFCKESVCSSGC